MTSAPRGRESLSENNHFICLLVRHAGPFSSYTLITIDYFQVPNLISLTMKFISAVFLTVLLIAVTGKKKPSTKQLKTQISTLEDTFSSDLEDVDEAIAEVIARMDAMEAERVELDQAHAWQALHMAAAAACRGSTASGGTGPWGNTVIAKENTRNCNDICGDSQFNLCDADVAISGYIGKAQSYSQRLGHFYNYGCEVAGHPTEKFDEVKAAGEDVFKNMDTENWFYRFCCCRQA